jgi:hypothetical protein
MGKTHSNHLPDPQDTEKLHLKGASTPKTFCVAKKRSAIIPTIKGEIMAATPVAAYAVPRRLAFHI